ncbi:glycosyltransferase family A protein [Paenibacillus validus]|uniref:glycosyltransferase family A protein n=1 Tax=Paenibacillus TaxID=44249 RepID=UPI0006D038A4|nr:MULTISPECIES: glycosyltransferase family A protein [Paenibacillus]MED4600708.1 glycosyltransferase family A protein [Paenibacillus validus]MED4606775.1 glycosyltransferase family A protein [Paenibacillus validus]
MMIGLVWIMGFYAAGIAIIHTLHWRWKRHGSHRITHYVLRTRNNGRDIEWYLRSLHLFSWIKGKSIEVTLADEGSTDETIAIAERLSKEHHLNIHTRVEDNWDEWMLKHEHEQIVIVQLNQADGLETAFKYM